MTLTVDQQFALRRPSWGTMTTNLFVDAGVATWRGERTRRVAPGAGFHLYLRNVAIPAVGLDVGWSTEGHRPAPTFFVGFGF